MTGLATDGDSRSTRVVRSLPRRGRSTARRASRESRDTSHHSSDAASNHSQSSSVKRVRSPPRRGRSRIRHDSRDSRDSSHHSSGAASNHSQSSVEEKMPWRSEKQWPAIRLQNGSRHLVSYHVLQEDKITTKAVERVVTATIQASLNATITEGAGARAEGSRSAATSTRQEGAPHLLVEDFRVRPSSFPGDANFDEVGTTIPFPEGCKALRVFAFYRGEATWIQYKNKVYNRKARTVHVITAVDEQLDIYCSTVECPTNLSSGTTGSPPITTKTSCLRLASKGSSAVRSDSRWDPPLPPRAPFGGDPSPVVTEVRIPPKTDTYARLYFVCCRPFEATFIVPHPFVPRGNMRHLLLYSTRSHC